MRTILVINDHSPGSAHAASFALSIARKMGVNLLLANVKTINEQVKSCELVTYDREIGLMREQPSNVAYQPKIINQTETIFKSGIAVIDLKEFTEEELAIYIIKRDIWMIVKGITNGRSSVSGGIFNIQSVINKVKCPLLLIPETYKGTGFEHIVYSADLRYCRLSIMQYLAELAKPYQADVMIAHLSAKGLPNMDNAYALSMFNEKIGNRIKYNQLIFNNIKEDSLSDALDITISGMHADLLVMVNHRFHFTRIVGHYITNALPDHITMPLLIFPY
jgi:nucleotide-binding universal stress UspA family protein